MSLEKTTAICDQIFEKTEQTEMIGSRLLSLLLLDKCTRRQECIQFLSLLSLKREGQRVQPR